GAAGTRRAAEYLPGQALAVEANERRVSAERSYDQGNMFFTAGRISERDHLAGREVVKRKLCPRNDDRHRGARRLLNGFWVEGDIGFTFDQRQCGQQSG